MTDLEREAREAAEGLVPNKGYGYKAVRDVVREEGFVFGYITAAEPRERRIAELERLNKAAKLIIDDLHAEEKKNENRIAELEAKVAEAAEQRDAWLEHLRRSHEGLMILHDRLDLQEMAGLRCGDFMADAVPFMIAELDRQNILIARMEVKFATCPWIAMAFCTHAASRNGYPLEAEQVSEWLKTTATI